MLFVQSLDEVVYEDVPEGERFKLQPDVSFLLYRYKNIPFHYELSEHIPAEIPQMGNIDPGRYYAQFGKARARFMDFKTQKPFNIDYTNVDVWRLIDDEFKDVFIAHELFEMVHSYLGKLPEKKAHANAVIETDEYLQRHFTEAERQNFQVMLKNLSTKRLEPTKMRVMVHKIGKLNVIERQS